VGGHDAAVEYAETLRVVLRPWVQARSFAYRIIEGRSRDDFLEGVEPEEPPAADEGWWLPTRRPAVHAAEPR